MPNKLIDMFQQSASPEEYIAGYCAHMQKLLEAVDAKAVAKLTALIEEAGDKDKTIFLVANGGSAVVGSHWVTDLSIHSVVEGRLGFRVISLADNPYSMTALANDTTFEQAFALQLKAAMRPGDLVIALSVSGNSPNILRAIEYANEFGAVTVGCTGFDGGALRTLAQHSVHLESTRDEYGPVENTFDLIMHIVTGYLTMKRGRLLSH